MKYAAGGDTEVALEFKRKIVNAAAPKPRSALKRLRPHHPSISTGVTSIDQSLGGGGLRPGTLTSLIGRSGVSKTQVCLQASLVAASGEGIVVYIDTANSFS